MGKCESCQCDLDYPALYNMCTDCLDDLQSKDLEDQLEELLK